MTLRSVPVVDRITDAFFALDTDFRFTYLNDRAETLLERSRADLIGRVMWDEFPQTVETQFPDGFHRAMEKQVSVSFDIYHARLETWFEATAYPSETGLSVYMRDVTERKQQERVLAQHAAVVEAISDGVITLNRNREIVSVNDAMESLLGVDRESLLGEHVEIVPELAAIDNEDAVEIGRAITDVDIGTADTRHVEVPFTDADGTDRMVEFRFVPIEDNNATVAGIIRDVTDQYEYERVAASLHEVTRWLLESDDPEEVCSIAVHAGSDLLNLPISGIWLLDEEQGYLDPVAGTAGAYEEFGGLPRFNPPEGLVWDVFEAGEVEYFDDLTEVDGLYNDETPLQSEIIAPIGTHGVLMTGSLQPNRFDETDVELLSTLVENTRAALDRADREQLLRERTNDLERQTERLQGIADVLSTDLKHQLDAVSEALEDERAGTDAGSGTQHNTGTASTDNAWQFPLAEDSVETMLDRTERLVDDVREFARNATAVGTRNRILLEQAVHTAATASRLDADAVALEEPAVLRADAERFARLLETAFDDIAARVDEDEAPAGGSGDETDGADGNRTTVRIELLGVSDDGQPTPTQPQAVIGSEFNERSRGFVLVDTAASPPIEPSDRVFDADADADDSEMVDGLGLALVRAIADAHDWTLSIESAENGTRIEVRDVTTLEPL
ncbi:PAS/PAC sensor protein [Natrialba chahannaoensis JCM 10990]|uniref:histidine kinase n=1 Tax=Natrialba chahannaoensis JCM 10990 TaxID=1227492 RepID=M0ANV3_9EURY|nr:PAS domain-containing protein [Natrialba chahannaoensis]ELY99048.1 PAS/PAC sensor protein [Natrialba chahannaoensis JCM 10990]